MRILIATAGTSGDVLPYTGLAVRLQESGHEVALATHMPFAEAVRCRGLEFRALPVDPLVQLSSREGQRLVRSGSGPAALLHAARLGREFLREFGHGILAAAEHGVDVILLSTTAVRAGSAVADALGVPSIGVSLQPITPTGDFPPAFLGWKRQIGRAGNRAAAYALMALTDFAYAPVERALRRDLGLSTANTGSFRTRERSDWPVLHAFSPTVVPRPSDWRSGAQVAGYLWPAHSRGWRPIPTLVDFLESGPPPVFVGLGSMIVTNPEQLVATVVDALRIAGVRGIVQRGWGGLESHSDDVLTIGEVPHEWLFPRTAALIHAAGAGTTAAGLRAGIPAIPIPVWLDQPFWAARLAALGVSPGPIALRELSSARLATAICGVVQDSAYRRRARWVAERIADEDGAGQVAKAVELVGPNSPR
ncbi:glycosyltransferase [Saccharopolyspora hattusasensis]|uniref:glycosyltransferase n=1 Tax=Saccharopolyspora hattusasensis TaxID=1128679 RepID=UPI003D99F725